MSNTLCAWRIRTRATSSVAAAAERHMAAAQVGGLLSSERPLVIDIRLFYFFFCLKCVKANLEVYAE